MVASLYGSPALSSQRPPRQRPMRSALVVTLWATQWCNCAAARGARPTHHENTFAENDLLDLRVFVSASPRFTSFNDSDALVWHETGVAYGDGFAARERTVQVPITDALLANGTFYAHLFVTKADASPDPRHGRYDRWASTSAVYEVVAYGTRNEPIGLHNLITGEPAPWEAELRRGAAAALAAGRPAGEYISYWRPKLHAQLLIDTEVYPLGGMPPLMQHFLHNHRLIASNGRYRPLLYVRSPPRAGIQPSSMAVSHPSFSTFVRRLMSSRP